MAMTGVDSDIFNGIERSKTEAYHDVLDGKEPQNIHDTVYMQSYRFYRMISNEHNDRFGDHISDGD